MKSMCNAIVTDVPVASSYISRSLRSWNGRFRLDGLLCTCHFPGIHDFHASELRTSFAGKCHPLHINRADFFFSVFLPSSFNVHCDNSISRGRSWHAISIFTVMIPWNFYGAYSYDISLETHENETTDVTRAWLMLHMQHITFKWRYHSDSDMHLCFILRMRYVHINEHSIFY